MEGGGFDALPHGPGHRAVEHPGVVAIHAEHKAAVDHHAVLVQPRNRRLVIPHHVVELMLRMQVGLAQRLKADEQAAQSAGDRFLQQSGLQHRLHGGCRLPHPPHAAHAVKQRFGKAPVAEEMVVEEEEMPSGQPLDLRQCGIHLHGVVRFAALVKRRFITEVALVRAPPRHDNGIRHKVELPLDQITARGGLIAQRAHRRAVFALRASPPEIRKEQRPDIFTGPEANGVRVLPRFLRQCGDVQSAEHDIHTSPPVMVGDLVGAVGRADVHLDDHQIRRIRQVERFHVLVMDAHLVIGRQVARQRRQSQRREERILDRTPVGAGGFRESGENHFDAHGHSSLQAIPDQSERRYPRLTTRLCSRFTRETVIRRVNDGSEKKRRRNHW